MPNLKDIRRRIKSVKNTQKITQAMRMVAAAKVKRAENKVKAIRPYSEKLMALMAEVSQNSQALDNLDANHPVKGWLTPQSNITKPAIVVISSDRGLCGAFNGSVIRQALKLEASLRASDLEPVLYPIGRKAASALTRYSNSPILGEKTGMTAAPSSADAKGVIQELSRAYLAGEIDDIVVLSTHFRSMVSYKVLLTSILPGQVSPDSAVYPEGLLNTIAEQAGCDANTASGTSLIEPDPVAVLENLIPLYMTTQLYTLMLESSASELAARMMAMANATSNAGEMIGKLSIQYNKLRQAAITQEILEIVGGAQALA